MTLRHWGWIKAHVALWLVALVVVAAIAPRWALVVMLLAFSASMLWVGTRIASTVELHDDQIVWRTPFGLVGEAMLDQLSEVEPAGGRLSGTVVELRFVDGRAIYVTHGPQFQQFMATLRRSAPQAQTDS